MGSSPFWLINNTSARLRGGHLYRDMAKDSNHKLTENVDTVFCHMTTDVDSI